MKGKLRSNFLVGMLVGTLVCVIYWYWQKSTRAEDGALALLERLRQTETRIQQAIGDPLEQPPAPQAPQAISNPLPSEDNLTLIKGVGPVFASRLRDAGVKSIAQVAGFSPEALAEILQIQPGRAEKIVAEAKSLGAN